MKKWIMCTISAGVILASCGCNIENDESMHSSQSESVSQTSQSSEKPYSSAEITSHTTYIQPDEVIPPAVQTSRLDGERLSYSMTNIYSGENYYTLTISGVRLDTSAEADIDTTYIKGELYGDFRFDLYSKGELIDTYKINIPRDDRFLILESVTDELSYGCEVISNKREFSAEQYPDLVQLDFHIIDEVEAPQYARYFAVFDGQITEIPVYENGEETAPYGTHPVPESAGVMIQRIVASQADGSYTVLQYEYTFDTQNRRLLRQQVRFTG